MSIQITSITAQVDASVTVHPPVNITSTDAHRTCLFVATEDGMSRIQIVGPPHALRALVSRMEAALDTIDLAVKETADV